MRLLQLEAWVLDIAAQIAGGMVPEDSRLELKASWPSDHGKAARRLAGHANAALGEPILWIVGLDERRGATGVESVETATWLERVFSYFDGVSPSVRDFVVKVGDKTVVAMLFETVRAPFVVRNPAFGTEPTPIRFEVPWRDGTRVRSACRGDLIRLLGDVITLPDLELLGAEVELSPADDRGNENLFVSVNLYLVPRSGADVVIPFHRSHVLLNGGEKQVPVSEGHPYSRYLRIGLHRNQGPVSHTVYSADNEVIFEGPGRVTFKARSRVTEVPNWGTELQLQLVLGVAASERPLVVDVLLRLELTRCRGHFTLWERRSPNAEATPRLSGGLS